MTKLGFMTLVMLLFGFSSEARARPIDQFSAAGDRREQVTTDKHSKAAQAATADPSREPAAESTRDCAETLTKK